MMLLILSVCPRSTQQSIFSRYEDKIADRSIHGWHELIEKNLNSEIMDFLKNVFRISCLSSIYKGWYHHSDSDTAIVFVHGLFSDSKQCWTNIETNTFWPELIKEDGRFGNPSLFMAEFFTSPSSGDYKVSDCSDEIFKAISVCDEQSYLTVLEKKNIVFVGHSTGGIVIRHLLESKQDYFVGKNLGVVLYASPSFGSKWASFFSFFSKLMNNRLCQELRWGSEILEELDDRFKELVDSKKLRIRGYEAYENKPPFIGMSKIVSKESAGRYFSKPRNVPNTDHSSIVKPSSKSAPSHEWLVLFFQNNSDWFVSDKVRSEKKVIELSDFCKLDCDGSLFEFFKPSNDKHYLEREFDLRLASSIKNHHIWLCGPTGVGKTVALQRAIYKSNVGFKYISLGACIDGTVGDMLVDILLGISPDFEFNDTQTSYVIKRIIEIIRNHCEVESFILLIEEIPISDQSVFEEFSRSIYSILVGLRDVKNFKLILSSIYQPASIENTEFEKLSESFQVIKSSYWNDENIEMLISLIKNDVDDVSDVKANVEDFEGSPRKVKIYFRDSLERKKLKSFV
ncbi:hypothetical protein A1OW_01390 [Enterovibrio norvegicus]|uniref:ATP-binding protein n=1 Tax=Enterovibrio norvegicus TaxID=188144 RepID=UPI000300C720|nr:ATP-binding protein [Enterovibrio norvegicus]OEF49752.1 hypothetical protein A1OW_01390 [Enterovibrio norvegicus]